MLVRGAAAGILGTFKIPSYILRQVYLVYNTWSRYTRYVRDPLILGILGILVVCAGILGMSEIPSPR